MKSGNSLSLSISRRKKPHISGIDALKTLAIIGVTLFHVFPDTLPGGYMGVSLFFVITGYLLAYTSKQSWLDGRFSLLNYYVKRIKRIYPLLLLVILLSVGAFHFLLPAVIDGLKMEVLSILLGYNNWWQIAQNADYFTRLTNVSPFTHLWFMGIELQYYLIWPAIFSLYIFLHHMLGEKIGAGIIFFLGLLSAGIMPYMFSQGADITRLYYGTDTRIYALLLGAGMGLMVKKQQRSLFKPKNSDLFNYVCFGLLLGLTVLIYAVLDGQNPATYEWAMFLSTLGFCWLIHIVTQKDSPLGYMLDLPFISWLGKKSYGLFLWQYPVIYLFKQLNLMEMEYAQLTEIALIVLLTIWSEAMQEVILKRRFFFKDGFYGLAHTLALVMVTFVSVFFMCYGCHDIAVSAASRNADQTELKAKLEANAAEMAKENEAAALKEAPKAPKEVNLNGIVCIGDSVMLGSAGELHKVLPNSYIDAEVSRYVGGGSEVAKALLQQGKIGNIVVISLGTNGPIAGAERYEVQTRQLLKDLGDERQIFWVNVYCPKLDWQKTNNDYINKIAAEHKNVTVIDWYSLIAQHPEWLVKDGIHPNDTGTKEYARLVHDSIVKKMQSL